MTVLAKPEDHPLLFEVLMLVRKDRSQMYPIPHYWMVSPVATRTEAEGSQIEQAMKTNSEDIKHMIYVDTTGVTPGKDLFSIVPKSTFHTEEPGLPNGKTIAKLLPGGMAYMDGFTINPIRAVRQAERGRWRFRAYTHHSLPFLNKVTDRVEFALPNHLELVDHHTLRIDDKNIQAEVGNAERDGIAPPPQSIRFPSAAQCDSNGTDGSHDTGEEAEWDHDEPQ